MLNIATTLFVFHNKKKKIISIIVSDLKEFPYLCGEFNTAMRTFDPEININPLAEDGIQSKRICDEGIRMANEIIERCRTLIRS